MSETEITRLLLLWGEGKKEAADELFGLLYRELRRLAHLQLRRRRPGETLSTTALVNEAYLKLVDRSRLSLAGRHHFYSLAARAMRQILVDYARRQGSEKRGGKALRSELEAGEIPVAERTAELVAIDEALTELEALEPRLGRVVELRFFAGLSVEEAAQVLEVGERTVRRDWQKARAFLYRHLRA